jgi:diguanylate cyclase (GGDEF)-like protein
MTTLIYTTSHGITATIEGRLARNSAVALMIGAGAVTLLQAPFVGLLDPARVNIPILVATGVVCLLSAALIGVLTRNRFSRFGRVAVALWGLVLLQASSLWGRYAAMQQARIVYPVFLMVVLVWLGLVGGRGMPAAFAPVTALAALSASMALSDSTVQAFDAFMVIAVSVLVAETIAWVMLELHEREQLLAVQTLTDPLTGLLNRTALRFRLEELSTTQDHVLLAFVDLNNFKHINDSFGHEAGDDVLVEVARRLQLAVRADDLVARFGGDEFVIVARNPPDQLDADAFVDRIRDALDAPWPQRRGAQVTASVGVVEERDGRPQPEELLRAADAAMYARKHGMVPSVGAGDMSSMSLRRYRGAVDGMGGGFAVLRAERREGEIIDWQIIEANSVLRDRYREVIEEPVGARLSELDHYADNSALRSVYELALGTGETQEREISLSLPPGVELRRRFVVVPLEPDIVAAMTFPIVTAAPLIAGWQNINVEA